MGYYPILDHAPKGRAESAGRLAALAPPPRRVLNSCRTGSMPTEGLIIRPLRYDELGRISEIDRTETIDLIYVQRGALLEGRTG